MKGELCVTGNILVAGFMEGKIACQNSISIGISGAVRGTVRGRELVVSGMMEGDVYAEVVEILAGGRIQGTIQAEQLIIERGGFFSGASSATTKNQEKSMAPLPEVSQAVLLETDNP
ncbi:MULTISPECIES: polymer-forming cytoskeletal protein [unclassified Pseudomonas]|uniref:bactofilin family protein n=1 Tax=unclassified Pseudomonas TaxID=196821 RepID=UPI0015B271E7|nr:MULTISPECIES: polymer-forming cytoskeletal protein [unclassified Pseudomonas]